MVRMLIEGDEMKLDYKLIFGIDKQMHFFSYTAVAFFVGIVVILLSDDYSVKRRISYMWMILVTTGIIEEYRQYMIPNRSAEFLDAIANMLGITMGLAVPLFIWYVIKDRNYSIFKMFVLYHLILIPLLFGLILFNQVPFVKLEASTLEKLKNLAGYIGLNR